MKTQVLFAALGAFAAPALAHAQALDEIVVTGSRLPANAALSVQVIPETRLAVQDSLASALDQQAEVFVQAAGGRSGNASLFLRGADPNFTAVMLDGVVLNNPTNTRGGSVNVSEIGAAALERVEVVAGPLSGVYGSGALAGAVNLVVAAGSAEPTLRATLGVGSQQDYLAAGRWRGPLAAGYGGSFTVEAADDGEPSEGARFKTWSLTGKVAPLDRAEAGRLVFRLSETDARAFPDSSGGPRLAVLRDTDQRKGRELLAAVDQPLIRQGAFRLDAGASILKRRDRTTTPGVAPSDFDPMGLPEGRDDSRYTRVAGQVLGRYHQGAWAALGGLEVQEEEGESEGELVYFGFPMPTAFDLSRTTRSAFVEAQRSAGGVALSAGGRIDRIDGLGSHATGRTAIRYDLPSAPLALRASYGAGFKAPSLYALGNPLVGNPELGPEKSRGGEVGLIWDGGEAGEVSLTIFRTRYSGLIDFDPGPPPRLVNRDSVTSKGVSAAARATLSEVVSASLQAQYVETKDDATGEPLLNRPRWRVTSSANWRATDRLTLMLRHSFTGARFDSSVPTGVVRLASRHAFGLEADWRIDGQTSARAVVENAADEPYEDAVGFPAPGRRLRLVLIRDF